MTRKLSAAVVGAGWGARYLQALDQHPLVEVAAVCAATSASARNLAERHAVPRWYTDYEEMLEAEQIDALVIATPNDLHYPIAMRALECGAHVCCEKPLALDLGQAEAMAEAARRLGRTTIVPFTWRFVPGVRALRELVEEGGLGDLYHARISYVTRGLGDVHGEARWQHDLSRAGSGVLANLGSHAIAVARWLLGDLRRVCGTSRSVIDARADSQGRLIPCDADDTFSLIAKVDDGTPVVIETGWVAFVDRVRLEISLFGSAGSAELRFDSADPSPKVGRLSYGNAKLERPVELALRAPLLGSESWDDLGSTCARLVVAEFIDAIAEGRPAAPDFAEGLEVQRVMEAALASASSEMWVDVAASRGVPSEQD